jgi:hypothetical protein
MDSQDSLVNKLFFFFFCTLPQVVDLRLIIRAPRQSTQVTASLQDTDDRLDQSSLSLGVIHKRVCETWV